MQSSATIIAKNNGKYPVNTPWSPAVMKDPKKVTNPGTGTDAPLNTSTRAINISKIGATKIKSIIDNIAGEGYYDELASRFYENQNNYIKAYTTNDWSEYNRTADAMDVFLNALD